MNMLTITRRRNKVDHGPKTIMRRVAKVMGGIGRNDRHLTDQIMEGIEEMIGLMLSAYVNMSRSTSVKNLKKNSEVYEHTRRMTSDLGTTLAAEITEITGNEKKAKEIAQEVMDAFLNTHETYSEVAKTMSNRVRALLDG